MRKSNTTFAANHTEAQESPGLRVGHLAHGGSLAARGMERLSRVEVIFTWSRETAKPGAWPRDLDQIGSAR
jgi:capsular polysaccharide biosynthesis protein